jgi:hypothetical protein
VLERDANVSRLHRVQPLMVATDIVAAQATDFVVHDLLGPLKAIARTDLIALCLEAAQELRPKVLQPP